MRSPPDLAPLIYEYARALTDGFDHRILPTGGNEVTVRKRLRIATEGTDDGHHDGATKR